MDLLLDTHALLWFVGGDDRLSTIVRRRIEDPNARVLVSAASAWEIATKFRLGKLPGGRLLAENFVDTVAGLGFETVAISPTAAQQAGRMDVEHRDPFDRVLAAQARELGVSLASADTTFDAMGVSRIW